MTGDVMTRHLRSALDDPELLLQMAGRASSLAQPDAAKNVARACLEMGEQTCFLHALCRTPLQTRVSVTRR